MLNNLNSLRMELRVMSTSEKGCELILKEWVIVKIHRKGFETLIVISFVLFFLFFYYNILKRLRSNGDQFFYCTS